MGAVRPKKKLGQHFLADGNIARKIANSLQVTGSGPILEIGPGMGMLTRFLLQVHGERVWVVEIDGESVEYLQQHFEDLKGRIIHEDFLHTDISAYFKDEFLLIGNLPYNISSPIFFKLLEYHSRVPQMVAMVQKEVAERIAAGHGSKTYGILSVLLQSYFRLEYLFTVSENVFVPPPKVKSAVLRLTRLEHPPACDQVILIAIVKAAFNQRRKMLRNALSGFGDLLEAFPEIATKRAEQLSVAEYIRMAEHLTKISKP